MQEMPQGNPVYRLINTGESQMILVLGINELFGVDKDQLYQPTYVVAHGTDETDSPGVWLFVSATYDFEPSPREFSVFFDFIKDRCFLEALVDGALIIFTSVPAPMDLVTSPQLLEIENLIALLNEYGGCRIEFNSHTQSAVQNLLNTV